MFKYAGVGSRSTPPEILKVMDLFANAIARDSLLRTGAAEGADQAFEFGAVLGGGRVEIYLPWKGFNGRNDGEIVNPGKDALELAEHYHPGWKHLKQGARKLMARNGYQVLGPNLYDPVEMVVCWTPDGSLDGKGSKVGGTGQALRIADDYDIPVLNLQRPDHLSEIESFFES
jgi:hypothetical protein